MLYDGSTLLTAWNQINTKIELINIYYDTCVVFIKYYHKPSITHIQLSLSEHQQTAGTFHFPTRICNCICLGGSDFRLYDGSNLSIDEMVGAWCFGCLSAQRGLPVGFLLLRYSVLFTVESLSLLYFLVISWFICSGRWCIDKLGVFHANQISMCLDPHLN